MHRLLDAIVDRGAPVAANRVIAVLRRLYGWAIERGCVALSPVDRVKAPTAEVSRDCVLDDAEIRLAWQALESVGWPFGAVGQLLLLTGARRTEVSEMRWAEIDITAKTWTIAKERSKNGVAHMIPLSDTAIEILNDLKRVKSKDDFVFTFGRVSVSGFAHKKLEIDAAIAAVNGAPIPSWTYHDLRRTTASGMAGMGIAPHVVEAVLNHKNGTIKGVAAIYNRYSYATEKRGALDGWARRLEAIVAGEASSNVVEFSGARA